MSALTPYSGGLSTLPLRNRSVEGVPAVLAKYEEEFGTMEDLRVSETPEYSLREHRGWVRLTLCATFAVYSCIEGDYCDLADASAFRASVAEGRRV